jgi:methionine-S-sulfoxide reductase
VTETTGHAEVVRIVFDTQELSYQQVLDYYFRHTDPTDGGGQFCDRGDSYRPVIFYADESQKSAAEATKKSLDASGILSEPIETQIAALTTFWPAEAYHQDFHETNPGRYLPYRYGCGRDKRVKSVWARDTPAK